MNTTHTPEWLEKLSDFVPFMVSRSGLEDYEDLFQNTALKILTSETESDVPKGYIFNKIRQCANDSDRKRKRRVRFTALEVEPASVDKSEHQQLVKDYLSLLSVQAQEVLVLHYLEGNTWEEIADILNDNLEAVKSRGKRALQEIRNMAQKERCAQ